MTLAQCPGPPAPASTLTWPLLSHCLLEGPRPWIQGPPKSSVASRLLTVFAKDFSTHGPITGPGQQGMVPLWSQVYLQSPMCWVGMASQRDAGDWAGADSPGVAWVLCQPEGSLRGGGPRESGTSRPGGGTGGRRNRVGAVLHPREWREGCTNPMSSPSVTPQPRAWSYEGSGTFRKV